MFMVVVGFAAVSDPFFYIYLILFEIEQQLCRDGPELPAVAGRGEGRPGDLCRPQGQGGHLPPDRRGVRHPHRPRYGHFVYYFDTY